MQTRMLVAGETIRALPDRRGHELEADMQSLKHTNRAETDAKLEA